MSSGSTQHVYKKRGFIISTFLMDGQFDVIRGDLSDLKNITLNTVARGKHVPEVERQIRTIKDFPAHDGISDTLSPRSIIHGSHIDFNKHARLEFGAYVQAHEEHDNIMATRTTGAIALRPTTGNAQGGYYLYSLSTGRVLKRNHWTALPMPREVIDRVHVLARRSTAAPTFADRDGAIIPNDNDDDDDPDTYIS
ncbi:Reverse transcriptase (RNA-dependent DNA polymerase) [Fragilaria crotonensis]|nr:Reverse transcriptase (RNA-dependent DNA polymerase) [Fragilaria crotonensis]